MFIGTNKLTVAELMYLLIDLNTLMGHTNYTYFTLLFYESSALLRHLFKFCYLHAQKGFTHVFIGTHSFIFPHHFLCNPCSCFC